MPILRVCSASSTGPAARPTTLSLGGDTRFVVLDCGEDKPDDTWVYYGLNDFTGFRQEQVDFLQKELAGKACRKAAHRVLIHHIPLWAEEEPKDPGAVSKPCRELWTPVLKKSPH